MTGFAGMTNVQGPMTKENPMKALSIRQPWAWLIVQGYKDIENRNWSSGYTGPLLIHAGKGMTRADYDACDLFVRGFATIDLPAYEELQRGGIVGQVNMTGCVSYSDSPWFVGQYGFEFTDRKPLPFVPCKGALGFFTVPD